MKIIIIKTIFIFLTFFPVYIYASDNSAMPSPGISNKEIIFGQSAAFKGASSALGSELWRGSQAYFEHINSNGGINGRKIVIEAMNDGYEGNITQKNTIQLIRKKVFGLFGYVGTPTIVKALPVIQKFSKEDIFLFSNFTGAQPQREKPHVQNVFNIRSSYRQETAELVKYFTKKGLKKIGVFIQYDAYGRSGADGVQRALKEQGLEIAGEVTYKRGAKFSESMNKQVEILKSKGVEAVVSVGAYAGCAAFIRDARNLGFNGPIANLSFVGSEALLELLLTEEGKTKKKGVYTKNLVNSQVVPPWSNTSIPVVKEYRRMMDKYSPSIPNNLKDPNYKPAKYSFVSLEGYINAKVLVEVLKRAPKKLTRSQFKVTAQKMNKFDVGMGNVLNFSSNDHQASDKVYLTTIKGSEYVLIK